MSYYFIGEIIPFAGNFAPKDWALCHGQALPISTHRELYDIIGIRFGGTRSSFNLPDLRGRIACGATPGSRPSTSPDLGDRGGSESVTLNADHIPTHTHHVTAVPFRMVVADADATEGSPSGHVLAKGKSGTANLRMYAAQGTSNAYLTDMISLTASERSVGQGTPVPIMQPFLAINYIIALKGVTPKSA